MGLPWSQEVLIVRMGRRPVRRQGGILVQILAHTLHLKKMLSRGMSFRAWVWLLAPITDMLVFHLEPEFKSQLLFWEQLTMVTY